MTRAKHAPETSLPWRADRFLVDGPAGSIAEADTIADADYIAHAANAYQQLVAALRDLVEAARLARAGALMSFDQIERANTLLASLGEES